jgi:hypothetical protein
VTITITFNKALSWFMLHTLGSLNSKENYAFAQFGPFHREYGAKLI